MSIDLDQTRLEEALVLLGEWMNAEGAEPVHLVVIGGSALLASGRVSRTTGDVDVWALRGTVDGEILPAYPLPERLLSGAAKVAGELGLKPGWLNAMAAMVSLPLHRYPPVVWGDLVVREYGARLAVSFAGRSALIHLKFHAAIDPARERRVTDRADLVALEPTTGEAAAVVDWLLREELVGPGMRAELRSLLKELGHEELIRRYPEPGA